LKKAGFGDATSQNRLPLKRRPELGLGHFQTSAGTSCRRAVSPQAKLLRILDGGSSAGRRAWHSGPCKNRIGCTAHLSLPRTSPNVMRKRELQSVARLHREHSKGRCTKRFCTYGPSRKNVVAVALRPFHRNPSTELCLHEVIPPIRFSGVILLLKLLLDYPLP
jgi:hypothetical protein